MFRNLLLRFLKFLGVVPTGYRLLLKVTDRGSPKNQQLTCVIPPKYVKGIISALSNPYADPIRALKMDHTMGFAWVLGDVLERRDETVFEDEPIHDYRYEVLQVVPDYDDII